MSSILKALKKLEDEKTARAPHALNIDAEILKGGRRNTPVIGYTLTALALFACGAGITYYTMTPKSQPIIPSRQEAQYPAAGISVQTSAEVTPAVTSPHPASITKSPPVLSAPVPARTVLGTKAPDRQPPKNVAAAPAAPSPARLAVVPHVAAPPHLKVNGIAYQDESADSVAVINGQSVSIGTTVDGARVEAILKDRVKFSRSGKTFEVMLGASAQ